MTREERFDALMQLEDDDLTRIVALLLSFQERLNEAVYQRPLIGGQRFYPGIQDYGAGWLGLIPA